MTRRTRLSTNSGGITPPPVRPKQRPAAMADDDGDDLNEDGKDDEGLLLTPKAAAALLGCSPATLATWRCRSSQGPRFVKLGARAVRYPRSDLLKWISRLGH